MITERGGGGGTVGPKFVMGMPYFLDDHGTVVIGFEFEIKGNTKIDETVNDLDGVEREGGERSQVCGGTKQNSRRPLELGGIEENHDFTFGARKSHSVLETPDLGALDEPEEFGVGVCDEAEVIDK